MCFFLKNNKNLVLLHLFLVYLKKIKESMQPELNYQNIYLLPQKTIVTSRRDCDTSVRLGKYVFAMPVYASNMKSVVNKETCLFFAKQNWFYTMHRFNIDVVEFIQYMHNHDYIASISIGVNQDSYDDIKRMLEKDTIPDYVTLDIANAWCEKAEKMIKALRETFPTTFIIAGNVACKEAVTELTSWGVDACKVGIAGGSVCTTKFKTGFHRPMVSTIQNCVENAKIPIIADGGIVHHGDIAKALALGATMVMAGSLFAGYEESAGDILEIDGHLKKSYFGSDSETNKNAYKNVEGKLVLLDYKGPMHKLLTELKEDLQSSISYAGKNCVTGLFGTPFICVV